MRSGGDGLSQIYLDATCQAREIAREKRFFQWDLEFPEAFVDLARGRGKPKQQQGFNAVVGNPPFIQKKRIANEFAAEDNYWQRSGMYATARGIYDVYMLFLELGVSLCQPTRRCCLLSPIPWLTQREGKPLREFLLKSGKLWILDFSKDSQFEDAVVRVVGTLVERGESRRQVVVTADGAHRTLSVSNIRDLFDGQIRIDVPTEFETVIRKIVTHSRPLSEFYSPTFGLRASSRERGGFPKANLIRARAECRNPVRYLEAQDLDGPTISWSGRWLDYQPREMYSPRTPELFLNPKILVPSLIGKRIIRAVFDDNGYFADQSLVVISHQYRLPILPKDVVRPSLKAVLRQLNSKTVSFFFAHAVVGRALGGGAIHATPGLVACLPIFDEIFVEEFQGDIDNGIAAACGFTHFERKVIGRWVAQELNTTT